MVLEHYLDVGGVDGEASAPDADRQIRLSGWRLTVDNTGEGPVRLEGIEVVKSIDAASPLLLTMCAEGRVAPQVRLMMRAVGHTNSRLLLDLREVVVGRVDIEATGDGAPVERIHLSFQRIWFGASRVSRGSTETARTWFSWDTNEHRPAS